MSITSYGSCAHLISGGGISFTAICTHNEALAIELALNIAAGAAEAQTKTSTNSAMVPCNAWRCNKFTCPVIRDGTCSVIGPCKIAQHQ